MTRTIHLGDIAKDTITGFEGTVIAVTYWINNCDRLTIQPKGVKDGKSISSCTFDRPRCEYVKAGAVSVARVDRGSDPVQLGDTVEDRLTGVKGIATARTEWMEGCSRVTIQPKELKDGLPVDAHVADERDTKIIKRAKPAPAVKTGGPRPAPTRR